MITLWMSRYKGLLLYCAVNVVGEETVRIGISYS